jgi:hypothetical protein
VVPEHDLDTDNDTLRHPPRRGPCRDRRPCRERTRIPAAAACGACFSYYCFLAAAHIVTRQTILPVAAFVWLPNLAFVLASAVLTSAGNNQNPSAPACCLCRAQHRKTSNCARF